VGTKDPRVDAYIAESADFAKPILRHVRKIVHATCPNVEETLKWGAPFFVDGGIVAGMAAFKQHCGIVFWHYEPGSWAAKNDQGRGEVGKLKSLVDLPSDAVLKKCIKYAMKQNAAGVKKSRTNGKPKPKLAVPADLTEALEGNSKARTTFEKFPPGKRRDYLEWILDAKQRETRQRRIETAVEWLAEGKSRNWKYESK
jgi:Bacteriocin-protection, YdeI or OmpD-Associated/Domain of unknown function (DU1801)